MIAEDDRPESTDGEIVALSADDDATLRCFMNRSIAGETEDSGRLGDDESLIGAGLVEEVDEAVD